jgi:hypothetical protein
MNYLKAVLSGLAALFLAFVVIFWPLFTDASKQHKAIGMGVFVGGMSSPVFWILAVFFFTLLFAASRIANRLLTAVLFWIPTVVISTLGVAILVLFTYLFIRLKHP